MLRADVVSRFIGEETYSKGASRDYLIPATGPSWCVDPLDGTYTSDSQDSEYHSLTHAQVLSTLHISRPFTASP